MARRAIHYLGSPALREPGHEVGEVTDEVRELVEDLFETMRAARGIGLAAQQVGLALRVAVVDTGEEPGEIVLIDPVIVEREGEVRAEEGCLSIPDVYGDVDRARQIVVEATQLDGTRARFEISDLTARAVQHEIDHLDGVLFLDHLSLLKRKMLLKKWKKLRKDHPEPIEQIDASGASA